MLKQYNSSLCNSDLHVLKDLLPLLLFKKVWKKRSCHPHAGVWEFHTTDSDKRWATQQSKAMTTHQVDRGVAYSPTCFRGVCQGPPSRVVTGTIPATLFVCTEPLTHPNNQKLWAFLIPTQSQWSQVELATAMIRYSNTTYWSAIRSLSFPHPLSPLFPPLQFPTWHRFEVHRSHSDMDLLGCAATFIGSLYIAGQWNCLLFLRFHILVAQNASESRPPWSKKKKKVHWITERKCTFEIVYCYGFGEVGTRQILVCERDSECGRACVHW